MKVLLNRCDNGIKYTVDYYDNIIVFYEDYQDSEGNLYRLYFKINLDSGEVKEMIENDHGERVCEWKKPTYVKFYCEEDEGEIGREILKKSESKYIPYHSDLLDLGCSVTVVKPGQQLIIEL